MTAAAARWRARQTLHGSLKLWDLLRQTACLMVGIPDYETYLEHRRTRHPGEPVMTYEEFFRDRQDARYAAGSGKIGRCC
jgi:uncharacterized short protein YbdD (DUF466 family)